MQWHALSLMCVFQMVTRDTQLTRTWYQGVTAILEIIPTFREGKAMNKHLELHQKGQEMEK